MRVAFIITSPYLPEAFGGCSVNTHALCRLLLRRGHAVAVLADLRPKGWRHFRQNLRRVLLGMGAVGRDHVLGYPVYRRRRAWKADEYLSCKFKPDIVVVQSG